MTAILIVANLSLQHFTKTWGLNRKAYFALRCICGGIRMGSVCGALTGVLMALGMYNGHDTMNDLEDKQRANDMTVAFIEAYKAMF